MSSRCVRQTTKKYLTRPSPPFPANLCCGISLMGNDGHVYQSVASSTGVCRWVKLTETTKSKGKSKATKSVKRKGKSKSGDSYRVQVVLQASLSSEDYPKVTKAKLSEHLRKYFKPVDVTELLEYGRTDLMRNLRLDGVTLSFEVPKNEVRRRLDLNSADDVKRWIVNHSLADGAWESGTSNFFVMKDDHSGDRFPPEIATISPIREKVKVK